jgi:preprotein translocase subunit SecD
MSKVKSAIITALLTIAILVAAFFAVFSYNYDNNIHRYNSIASSIHLGPEYTGMASATIYPEGVISSQEYVFLNEDDAKDYVSYNGVYVKNDITVSELADNVASDAKIIAARFGEKGYSGYIVSVEDGVTIKVSVPTNFTYTAYKGNNSSTRSTDLSTATTAISTLTAAGELTLRTVDQVITTDDDDAATYKARTDEFTSTALVSSSKTYSFNKVDEDPTTFFNDVTSYTVGSTAVISLNLTDKGQERLKDITTWVASSDSQVLYIFLGNTQMMSISCTETIDSNVMQFQSDSEETAEDTAIALTSAIKGSVLSVNYQDIDDVITTSATSGENAALLASIAVLVILVAAIVFFIVKYKKLGVTVALMLLTFALVMVYALYLLEITITVVGLLVAVLGLFLLSITNIIVFEEVRSQTSVGKTMQAAIKAAYKQTLWTVADIHIVLFIIGVFLAAVSVGEVAACGLIVVISAIASYILYWFTRLMWYVMASPEKDKFKFGGYKRVVYDD